MIEAACLEQEAPMGKLTNIGKSFRHSPTHLIGNFSLTKCFCAFFPNCFQSQKKNYRVRLKATPSFLSTETDLLSCSTTKLLNPYQVQNFSIRQSTNPSHTNSGNQYSGKMCFRCALNEIFCPFLTSRFCQNDDFSNLLRKTLNGIIETIEIIHKFYRLFPV